MNNGLLWIAKDYPTPAEALACAVAKYVTKYGQPPDVCEMHPSIRARFRGDTCGVRLVESNRVLPQHFWLGEDIA